MPRALLTTSAFERDLRRVRRQGKDLDKPEVIVDLLQGGSPLWRTDPRPNRQPLRSIRALNAPAERRARSRPPGRGYGAAAAHLRQAHSNKPGYSLSRAWRRNAQNSTQPV